MTAALCVCCGKPVPDTAYACSSCALRLAESLREASGHAEDAWTVIARQARYGGAGGARKAEPEPAVTAEDARRNPVTTFGWAASVEKPRASALVAEPMPGDFDAAARLGDVGNVVTTWARHVCETRGMELPARRPLLGPLCDGGIECGHASCAGVRHRRPPSALGEAAAWLATQVEWLRKRPEAREAFDELHDACGMLRRLVDRPASDRLVGMCDCGKVLYAANGRTVVQCRERTCGMTWHVDRSQQILRDHLDEQLLTAAEAARLAVHLDGGDRGVEQIRKLINAWSARGQIAAHGRYDGEPSYRFGDVASRLAQTPTRKQRDHEGAAA